MPSLWSFFGLPDPDGAEKPTNSASKPAAKEPEANENNALSQSTLNNEPPATVQEPLDKLPKMDVRQNRVSIPPNWQGPVTADGEPFHDLGVQNKARRSFPSRALRYVSPDEMKRIPTRGIAQRIANGDTVIVDLRGLVHMDSHQNACRRDLKMMTDEVGVGVFSLDQEDKLLMIPGTDVIVDVGNYSLGINPLM
ncbi:MAG: hypothetical protein VYA95_05500 [Candidatus Thermoplasmatota archaeon]|nr:hypothetical protein [Candidatus Thermoplasmatota archaeon]